MPYTHSEFALGEASAFVEIAIDALNAARRVTVANPLRPEEHTTKGQIRKLETIIGKLEELQHDIFVHRVRKR